MKKLNRIQLYLKFFIKKKYLYNNSYMLKYDY